MITKIKNFLLNFSVIFFLAAVTSFTAYNWKIMTALQKLSIPSILIVLNIGTYYSLKNEKYKKLVLLAACFLIGVLFATFGQVYQTGANTWILFRNWSLFIIFPAILSASYSIFFLFLVTICLANYFALTLFYDGSQAFFLTSLILFVVLIIYPMLSKKLKFEFKDNFYNSVLIIFYILFNIAGPILTFDSIDSNFINSVHKNLFNILIFTYPCVLVLAYLIIYKIYKKIIVLPFSILSAGIYFWTIFTKYMSSYMFFFDIGYFLMSILIFLAVFLILMRNFSTFKERFKNSFIVRIFKIIGSFLKFLILILVIFIFWLFMQSDVSFLLIGIILLWFSFSQFAELKKENKMEFLSFVLAIISFNVFFVRQFDIVYNLDDYILPIASINLIVFYIFWYFNLNKIMDLIFTPVNYVYLLIVFTKLTRAFSIYPQMYIEFIIIISLLINFLDLFFRKQVEDSKYSVRIERIVYGNNIGLIFWSLFGVLPFFVYSYNFEVSSNYGMILESIRNLLSLSLIIYIVFLNLKDFNLSNNISQKINYKNFSILSLLLIVIFCISNYIIGLNLLILLVIIYTYKNKKWSSFLLNIIICFYIFYYYYSMTDVTLLIKAKYMLYLSIILLIAYLVIKFFIKGVDSIEEKN